MRIRCVGHACLEIETSGLRIVSDPWWEGPAFSGQWHQWPQPQPAGLEQRHIDYVAISHAHDDHFHPPTLKTLRPGAAVLIPELLTNELGNQLRSIGFPHIVELPHGKTVLLRRNVRVTSYVNVTDSIFVFEDGDRVFVNVNDALHKAPANVIEYFCRLIRKRHAQIDTLFMNAVGDSWFPSCVRIPGKNDFQSSRSYEELVTENFVHVVELLKPRVACANGSEYLLLEPHNRWANHVRMERPSPEQMFRRRHPSAQVRIHRLVPNDIVDGIDLVQGATQPPATKDLSRALDGALRHAVEEVDHPRLVSPDELRALVARIDLRVRSNAHRVQKWPSFTVELRLREKPETAIRIEKREREVRVSLGAPKDPVAMLEMRLEIVEAVLREERGLDSIFCGHGAVASVRQRDDMQYVEAVLRLLSPRAPAWSRLATSARQNPRRALSALWRQRWPLALELAVRAGLLSHPDDLRHFGAKESAPKRAA